jgi:citrate lyase subunit beta/citryl-CoA lyase
MLEKARGLAADQVVLDLEDSVAPSARRSARGRVIAALEGGGWGNRVVSVRVNALTTESGRDDVAALSSTTGRLDTVIVPKVTSAADIQAAARALANRHEPVGIEALIEDAAGLLHVGSIAQADHTSALVFGPIDMSASLDIPRFGERSAMVGDPLDLARFMVLVAARATGLLAIDGPFARIGDETGLRHAAEQSRAMGYDAMWVIHPSQIDVVNAVFTPTPEELADAMAVVDALAAAAADDRGAVALDGVMVDEASKRAAERTIARWRGSSVARD